MSTHKKARGGPLLPVITLFEKSTGRAETADYLSLSVRATAPVEGKRKSITRSVKQRGLQEALRQACNWRYQHAGLEEHESPSELFSAALATTHASEHHESLFTL